MNELFLEQVGGPPLSEPNIALAKPLLIGRGTDANLVLPDASISRRHLSIEPREAGLVAVDLGSRSGTFLNDVRLQDQLPVPLQEHDRLRVGSWRFRVRSRSTLNMRQSRVGSAGNTSVSGMTQIGAPILAAEARLEIMVEFVAACTDKSSLEALFGVILDFCKRATNASRAAIFSADSMTPVCYFPDNFRAQALTDAFDASARGGVVVAELDSTLCKNFAAVAAIRIDGEALAFVQLEFSGNKPSDAQLEALHALVRLSGLATASIERKTAEMRVHRLQEDVRTAHEVQQAILPQARGDVAGLRYALHVHPGRVVAGDLVDVFALDEERCAIVLGDVSGQGFGAAVQMASAQAYLHAELLETKDPSIAAARCNRYLVRIGGGRFVSAFIAVFNRTTRALSVVDAGHGHAARLTIESDANQLSELGLVGSVPLGIDSGASFPAEILTLNPAERLLIYSDGIAEHKNTDGIDYSARMAASLKHSRSSLQDVETVLTALKLHGGAMPDDDATFLSIELLS